MRRSPKLRPNLWDGLIVLIVAVLAVGCGAAIWSGGSETEHLTAVVFVDGAEVERIDLHDVGDMTSRTYSSNGYTLEVSLRPDGEAGVQVTKSDCPTQDCVHTGSVRRSGQSIVCLPARIIIQLEGAAASDGGPDIVIG